MKTDDWVWGQEIIIWGDEPSHEYTFKILQPKKGRDGCLSLQFHNGKSESWLCLRGTAWTLVVADGRVCTRLLYPGDIQVLRAGVIHRLMGVTDDVQVAEPSSPDRHAADKSAAKDVVRLHCVMGRESVPPRTEEEAEVVRTSIAYTEEAIAAVERGEMPCEHNAAYLLEHGGASLWQGEVREKS